jgi:hypothetical protein
VSPVSPVRQDFYNPTLNYHHRGQYKVSVDQSQMIKLEKEVEEGVSSRKKGH